MIERLRFGLVKMPLYSLPACSILTHPVSLDRAPYFGPPQGEAAKKGRETQRMPTSDGRLLQRRGFGRRGGRIEPTKEIDTCHISGCPAPLFGCTPNQTFTSSRTTALIHGQFGQRAEPPNERRFEEFERFTLVMILIGTVSGAISTSVSPSSSQDDEQLSIQPHTN